MPKNNDEKAGSTRLAPDEGAELGAAAPLEADAELGRLAVEDANADAEEALLELTEVLVLLSNVLGLRVSTRSESPTFKRSLLLASQSPLESCLHVPKKVAPAPGLVRMPKTRVPQPPSHSPSAGPRPVRQVHSFVA